ncbi:MAG: hypothetical protein ACOXZ9_08380 [Bacteroidales bacterium]|jgi:hypothetical protein
MAAKNNHPLHHEIGKHLVNELKNFDNIKVVRDPACGGEQHIPLFLKEEKTSDNRLCQVDLMILKNNEIRVIMEIEESNIKPTQILGKLFASTISKYYIHKTEKNIINMADDVCFIQVLDTKVLKEQTKKIEQWKNIEKTIKNVLKKLNYPVKTYKIFYGKLSDKELLEDITQFIKNELKK